MTIVVWLRSAEESKHRFRHLFRAIFINDPAIESRFRFQFNISIEIGTKMALLLLESIYLDYPRSAFISHEYFVHGRAFRLMVLCILASRICRFDQTLGLITRISTSPGHVPSGEVFQIQTPSSDAPILSLSTLKDRDGFNGRANRLKTQLSRSHIILASR